jgi:nicotinate-nucleotide adenylyltransferase
MEFVRGAPRGSTVGILAGAFNPPTVAHLALIDAARSRVDQVICVLPREFPHKQYQGATLEGRLQMLDRIASDEHAFDVAVTEGGLFIEIAREARAAFGSRIDVAFLCGRDAAERILTWDYGRPGAIESMLEQFRLLVADRGGPFEPPPHLAHRIEPLETATDVNAISSSEVRRRIESGHPWSELVPPRIHDIVRLIYSRML